MAQAPSAPRRRLTANQLLLALLAAGFVAALLGSLADNATGDRYDFKSWTLFLATPVALWVTVLWWRRLDEAAREAHKWAWYWGATGGLVASLPLLYRADHSEAVALAARLGFEGGELIMFGILAVLLLQVAGYTIAWLFWWLRRR